jgi:hypothetical protein
MLSKLIEEAYQLHEAIHRGDPNLNKNLANNNPEINVNRQLLAGLIRKNRQMRDHEREYLRNYEGNFYDNIARAYSALGSRGVNFYNYDPSTRGVHKAYQNEFNYELPQFKKGITDNSLMTNLKGDAPIAYSENPRLINSKYYNKGYRYSKEFKNNLENS